MEDLVVGENDCKFNDIVAIAEQSTVFGEFIDKFFDIAIALETPPERIRQLRLEIIVHRTMSYTEGLIKLLQEWRSRKSSRAKLVTFLNILENKQLNDLANSMRAIYSVDSGGNNEGACQTNVPSQSSSNELIIQGQKNHITSNMPDLIKSTTWNPMIPAMMISKKIFDETDGRELESITSPLQKIGDMFQLIQKNLNPEKPRLYQEVISIFEELKQNNTVYILKKC